MPPVEPVLCKHLLSVLHDMNGDSLPEEALLPETEGRACRPISTEKFSAVLTHCMDKGWIARRKDFFERWAYWIKDAGENALREM